MSYWGLVVFSNILGAIPVIGGLILSWLWGGEFIGIATMAKIYALHIVLPLSVCFIILLHLMALHASLSTDSSPFGHLVYTDYFICIHFFQDFGVLSVFFLIYVYVIELYWNFALHEESFILFDPLKTSSKIIPEWFLLGFFGALKSVPSKIGGLVWLVVVLLSLGGILMTAIQVVNGRFVIFSESLVFICLFCVLSVIAGSVVLLYPLLELLIWVNLILFYFICFRSV